LSIYGIGFSIWEGSVDDVMTYVWEIDLLDIMSAFRRSGWVSG
jgi:hypothetical protein